LNFDKDSTLIYSRRQMRDFTIEAYKLLLKYLNSLEYDFCSYKNIIETPLKRNIIMRHDVDALPQNSLRTAQIERENEIQGTYYFRIVSRSNNPGIIRQIVALGHEIGYHYEDLALCKGNMDKAIISFEKNLNYFRQFYPVKTICMHGSPLSKYDNRNLWENYNYKDFGIIGEPYFDVDFSKVLYLTDTGRRWDGNKVSVRDKAGIRDEGRGTRDEEEEESGEIEERRAERTRDEGQGRILNHNFHSTFDIIKAAEEGILPDQIMITVHPQRWTNNPLLWTKELVVQNVKNQVKKLIVRKFS